MVGCSLLQKSEDAGGELHNGVEHGSSGQLGGAEKHAFGVNEFPEVEHQTDNNHPFGC